MNLHENIGRIKEVMGIISEDINLDDITFFKTAQGSKYIRMSDGRLRRYKSYHSNTGGEDQGLHDWSDMSIFVGPEHDKEARLIKPPRSSSSWIIDILKAHHHSSFRVIPKPSDVKFASPRWFWQFFLAHAVMQPSRRITQAW